MPRPIDPNQIKLVVLDVDGVLTDGRIGYGGGAAEEIKFFDVQDGLGIKLLQAAGLKVGILSGRTSQANRRRAEELGVDFLCEGEKEKGAAFARLLQQQRVEACQCMCMGDDLVDLPVLRRAGLAVAVANAVDEVKQMADWVCERSGGRGAVREAAMRLLKSQGKWRELVARYDQ